jgi:hypothetical protein
LHTATNSCQFLELRPQRRATHYTKHLVLLWKRASVKGERTRLGGSKRVMLSLALGPLAVLTRGAEVGMLARYSVRLIEVSRL